MKAVLVENFSWLTFADLRGFQLFRDDERLPGMIVVDVNNFDTSFKTAFWNYSSSCATVTYEDKLDGHDRRVFKSIQFGPFAVIDFDETKAAIQAAIV
jgi:hypothetical protein